MSLKGAKNALERWQMVQRQAFPLTMKINFSNIRIREWHDYWGGNVYVSFSGGKDSTVLLHMVRKLYPNIPAVFVDTGLEYPEIREFVKTVDDVTWLRPEMNFYDVIRKYGYPVVSKKVARQIRDLQNPTDKNTASRNLYLTGNKRDGTKSWYFKLPAKWMKLIDAPFKVSEKCCDIMKKHPIFKYERENGRKPYIGNMASDSLQRETVYLKNGCNVFNGSSPKSMPMGFWLEKDVWEYIKTEDISYSSIYDMGVKRTGCMFCMFGVHLENEPNRFQLMKATHPLLYEYCTEKLGVGGVLDYIGVKY